jgi:lysophospholipase L1-like esterase
VVLAATPGTAGQRNATVRVPVRAGTWSAPVTAQPVKRVSTLADQTVRQVVHTSIGGDQPQVRFSNEFGTKPVRIGAASLGLREGNGASSAVVPGTGQRLTFAGLPEGVIPAGGTLLSDPADLIVPPGGDLVISLYLPEDTDTATISPRSFQTNLVADGDVTGESNPVGKPIANYLFLTGVSVRARRSTSAVAVFGDSITRGVSTVENANHRWTDLLAGRLRSGNLDRGVLNLGLSGNRVLAGPVGRTGRAGNNAYVGESGVRRFSRDVLAQPAVSHVIVLLGVNDIGRASPASAAALIAGHRELIARGKEAGLTMIGGTLLPFVGYAEHFDNPESRSKRDAFNAWMRGSGEYDAVIDFDAALRDPAAPSRFLPAYDSGDHLHPNDAGMDALAKAVPLKLLE